ncbi:uncharacterized protein LDX57_001900 [Aspergillus melleus]|uniref:uncharacterized protein n=1 Tax=Aspergillus melleus TaxID=138277 RepID=UPI001E8E4B1A|nr:uncharacterized protein LDX57_001900 [Aspergillus melleus]KAH8424146.1 hypothetical protein LDX57_001900 [Aspergillus melleus]
MSTPDETPTDPSPFANSHVTIHFSAPDFTVPSPTDVNEKVTPETTIFNWGGVKIARIAPTIAVKFGSHVTPSEAKNRDIGDYGSLFDTYIFMDFVEGQTLDKVWDGYDEGAKARIANQLKAYFHELRRIHAPGYIGSVDSGPVMDPMLEYYHTRGAKTGEGPFPSLETFNNTLIDAYQLKVPKRHIKSFLSGMLSETNHQIVFTHGDLRHANIMVHEGSVTGILDWEFSGWYPEYWEFAKALYVWRWQNDWTDYLLRVLRPYYGGVCGSFVLG